MPNVSVTLDIDLQTTPSHLYDVDGTFLLDEDDTVLFDEHGEMTDLSTDMVGDVNISWGIRGGSIHDRVARPSKAVFRLNNSVANTNGLEGNYSQNHNNALSGFGERNLVSIQIDSIQRFWGLIRRIKAVPGKYGARVAEITAQGAILDMQDSTDVFLAELQEGQNTQDIINTLLDLLAIDDGGFAPIGRNLIAGLDSPTYFLDDATRSNPNIHNELNKLANSFMEYYYIKGDGNFTNETRQTRINNTTVFASLTGNEITRIEAQRSAQDYYAEVEGVSYPRRVGLSEETVFTLERAIEVSANTTTDPYRFRYVDETTKGDIGAKTVREVLVAGTDYKFGSGDDDGSSDKNGDLVINFVKVGATGVEVTFQNTSGAVGYVNLFLVSGIPIAIEQPTRSVVAGDDPKGKRSLKVDMPYQDKPHKANDLVEVAKQRYTNPWLNVRSVSFMCKTAALVTTALTSDPGKRIRLTEEILGLKDSEFFINGVDLAITHGGILECTWILERAFADTPWILETRSDLQDDTILGF